MEEKKYHAFISYRHADNKDPGRQWATWLHQAIETYEVPADLVGKKTARCDVIPARIYPIFRDEEELPAHSDLGNSIVGALQKTNLLIVLCSPRAVASSYVADEIDYFKKLGHSDRIIAAMIDGEPNTSWDEGKQKLGFSKEDECFPLPLQYEYDANGNPTDKHAEPIASDFRINNNGKPEQGFTTPAAYREHLKKTSELDDKAIEKKVSNYQQQLNLMLLKIIAGILGVPLGELTQRDKAYQLIQEQKKAKQLRKWLATVSLLTIIAISLGVYAYIQQQQALEEKSRAEEQANNAIAEKEKAEHNVGLVFVEQSKKFKAISHHLKAKLYALGALSKLTQGKDPLADSYVRRGAIHKLDATLALRIRMGDDFYGDGSALVEGIRVYNSVAFTPDDRNIVVSLAAYDDRVFDAVNGDELKTTEGRDSAVEVAHDESFISLMRKKVERNHSARQEKVLSSNDGSHFVVWSSNGIQEGGVLLGRNMKSWDLLLFNAENMDGRVINVPMKESIGTYNRRINAVSFSPSGDSIVIGGSDGLAYLVDITTGEVRSTFSGHSESVESVAISPNGKVLVTGSHDGTARVWDMINNKIITVLDIHYGGVKKVVFSNDGNTLVTVDFSNVLLWDLTSNDKREVRVGRASSAVISWNGRRLVSNGHIWDFFSGKKMTLFSSPKQRPEKFILSPSLESYATDNKNGFVDVWSVSNDVLLGTFKGDLSSLTFSPDGKRLSIAGSVDVLNIWDVYGGELLSVIKPPPETVVFSPDGEKVFVRNKGRTVSLCDVSIDKCLFSFEGVQNAVFSHDSGVFAIIYADINGIVSERGVELRDATSGALKVVLPVTKVMETAFSLDGKLIATASIGSRVVIWNVDTGVKQSLIQEEGMVASDIAFSPNGGMLVIAGLELKSTHLWDALSGKQIVSIAEGSKEIVGFSPDGEVLVLKDLFDGRVTFKDLTRLDELTRPSYYIKRFSEAFKGKIPGVNVFSEVRDVNLEAKPGWSRQHPNYWLHLSEKGSSMVALGNIHLRDDEITRATYWFKRANKVPGFESISTERLLTLEKVVAQKEVLEKASGL